MENNEILSAEQKRDYYAMIPNIVDCIGLSPHAYRLYGHFKKVVGEANDGVCWQSTKTLADACCMSAGSVSNSKSELSKHNLIIITEKRNDRFVYHNITVTDIWAINHNYFIELNGGGDGRSCLERLGVVQQVNDNRSTGETKNNPLSEEYPNTTVSEKILPDIAAENAQSYQEFNDTFPREEEASPVELPRKIDLRSPEDKLAYALELQRSRQQRVGNSPWLSVGQWLTPRQGITKEDMQHTLWLLMKTVGIPEPSSDSLRKRWPEHLAAMYTEAGGKWKLLEAAFGKIRDTDEKYRGDISKWAEKFILAERKEKTNIQAWRAR